MFVDKREKKKIKGRALWGSPSETLQEQQRVCIKNIWKEQLETQEGDPGVEHVTEADSAWLIVLKEDDKSRMIRVVNQSVIG